MTARRTCVVVAALLALGCRAGVFSRRRPKRRAPKKKQPAAPADDVDPVLDEAPTKGACSKHKDCTMKEFCAGDAGCLPCKQCSEHGDSYNGKCPCGPGKKKKGGKQAASKKKRTPPAPNSQKDLNMFAMMDKNKDGVITYDDEFVSWMKNEQDMTDMKEIKHFFRQEDQNKDGRLSWDEFTGPKGKTAPKVTAAAATSTPASGGAGGGGGGGGGSSGACSKHKDCTMK